MVTHTHYAHCGFFFFSHILTAHCDMLVFLHFASLNKTPHKFYLICAFLPKYIYIYIYQQNPNLFLSLIVLPTKQKFIFFSWFQVQFCYFSLHPIGEDPWAKVIKFFIAQSIYNTSISIPWWTRTTILLWKGIGFSFTQKIFFFHVKRYPKITKLISSSSTRKSN